MGEITMNKILKRESVFRGEAAIEKLAQVQITIAGAGTLGSNLAENLTRQGIENLRLIDMDRVEVENIGPQIYSMDDIGALKVDAAASRIYNNVEIEIDAINKELTDKNVTKLFKGSDLVVDAFDNQSSRQLVYDHCCNAEIPCLHVGMFEGYGEVVWNDVYVVPQDSDEDLCDYPMARNLAMLVTTVAAEEIINFVAADSPRLKSWSMTLNDLKIGAYG